MSSYNQLLEVYKKIHNLKHLGEIATWDQLTMMPIDSNSARADALSELNVLIHKLKTDKKIEDLLNLVSGEDLTNNETSTVKEMKKDYLINSILPDYLIRKKSTLTLKCEHAWRQQRLDNDWKGFIKNFKPVVEVLREEATIRSEYTGLSKYDSLISIYEPDMTSSQLDIIYKDIKEWLPSLFDKVIEKQKKESFVIPNISLNENQRKELSLRIMKKLGFNFNKGRLDLSTHGMCIGVPDDVRITTRLDETNFIKSLMVTIHETGHALYEQNLPIEYRTVPSGTSRSIGIHESQSLLYEMQLAKGKSFLSSILNDIEFFTGKTESISVENLQKIYTRVKPGFIRVEADEVTYPFHVILRYEIEKALIEKEIEVEDIAKIWDEKLYKYLGLRLNKNYKIGPLQDIHWPQGIFGYFPSYTLGTMYSTQLFNSLTKKSPNIFNNIEEGNYSQIFNWLKSNIWEKASILSTNEIIKNATGESLNPKYFKEYLEKRYL